MNLEDFLKLVNAGGNTALLAACYFIWKAGGRLSRIEALLEYVLRLRQIDTDKIQGREES